MTYPFASTVQYVKRTRNGSGSAYSGSQWTEAAPVNTTAVFAPGGSAELVAGGDTVTTQPALYGVDTNLGVTATDKFIIGGVPYEVDGDPADYPPHAVTDWQVGVVVNLRRVTG